MLSTGTGVKAPWLKSVISKAKTVIEQWLIECDFQVYCSISGGKDSLVAAHLITTVYPQCPLVWVNQGHLAEWEDCIELIEDYKEQGLNVIELCPVRSLLNLYVDYGIPLDGKMNTKLDKVINQKLMYDPLDEYTENNNIKGYAWGIRSQESKGRALYLKKHGLVYKTKADLVVCSPVGFWRTEAIWQYIDNFSLKYPAMYDIDRMTVRNGPPIGTTGINWGRIANLRLHFPDKYEAFALLFPEIRRYT